MEIIYCDVGTCCCALSIADRQCDFQAFEEAELPKLKEEKPGLTHTQYRDMIWKLWKKSPDNPLNQVQFRYTEIDFLYFSNTIDCSSGTVELSSAL